MPQSQESKVGKVEALVKPTGPSVVVPPQVHTPSLNTAPQVGQEPQTQELPKQESLDEFGMPVSETQDMSGLDEFGMPTAKLEDFDSEGAVVHKLRALKDFMDSAEDPTGRLVEKIGSWNIPSFGLDNIVAKAALKAEGKVLSIDEIKALPPEEMGRLRKAYNIASIPADLITEGLRDIVHETQAKIGWDEARTKSVSINLALNIARETPDIAAQLVGGLASPESVATLGYGQVVGAVGKTALAKNVLAPATEATADYLAGALPKWLVKPFTYKYGLPSKQEFTELMGERLRNIRGWFDVAVEQGAKLHDKMSPEAQILAKKLLTEKYDSNDISRMLEMGDDVWKNTYGIEKPQKFIDDVYEARRVVDESSDALIEEGLKSKFLTQKTADIIKNNRGKYLPRLYEIFENPVILEKVKAGRMSVEDAIGTIEDNASFLKRVAAYTDDQVAAFSALKKNVQDKMLNKLGKKFPEGRSLNKRPVTAYLSSLKKRGDLDFIYRKAMKEIIPPAYPVAKHIKDTRTAVENLKFFEKIGANKEWALPMRGVKPDGWVQIPKDKKFGVLSNKWVHPEVANEITSIHNITNAGNWLVDSVALGLNKTNKFWKMNKVLFSPATHVRNMVFNAVLMDMSGVPMWEIPTLIGRATKDVHLKGKYYKDAIKHNLIGQDFTSAELGDFLPKIDQFAKQDAYSHFKRGARGVYKKAGDIYRTEEEIFKVAKYIHGVENGLVPIEAAAEAEKWLFNYNRIAPLTEALRSNPVYNIPFITFTAKTLPRIAETALKNPFKLYKYKMLLDSVNKSSADSLGINDAELEYVKSKKPLGVLSPVRDSNGDPMWISLQQMIPWGIVEDVVGGQGKSSIPQALQPGGVTKIGYDIAYNQNTFTGKEIYGNTPARNAEMLGYIWKSIAPPTNPIPFPTAGMSNVQSVGPSIQKIADGAYASGVLPDFAAKILLAKKEGYYGASKGVDFALLDAVLGFKVEPVQQHILLKTDKQELDNAIKESINIVKRVARDAGLSGTPVGEMEMVQAEEMMQENLNRVLEDWDKAHP